MIKADPSMFLAYMNSAWAYTELAEYDSALYVLDTYRRQYKDNEIIRAYFSELHLYKQHYKRRRFLGRVYRLFHPESDYHQHIWLCVVVRGMRVHRHRNQRKYYYQLSEY